MSAERRDSSTGDERFGGVSPWDLLAAAQDAALAAGEGLLSSLGRLEASRIRTKSAQRDLVSEADLAAERTIVSMLEERFPEHLFEGEEEARAPLDDPRPRWIIDPLDGTVNYVHGLPMFSVSIALVVDGRPVVGVVHVPRLAETFTAIVGEGARLNGSSIHVSDKSDLGDAVLATGFPYRRNELIPNNLENFSAFFLAVRGLRRMGSAAIDLAYTAAGRLDGFWELYLGAHDVAAGALLVQEAGGLVTDPSGGSGWLRSGHLVAAGPGLHEAIRSKLVAPEPRA